MTSDKLAKRSSLLSAEGYFTIVVRNPGVCTHSDTWGRKVLFPYYCTDVCLCVVSKSTLVTILLRVLICIWEYMMGWTKEWISSIGCVGRMQAGNPAFTYCLTRERRGYVTTEFLKSWMGNCVIFDTVLGLVWCFLGDFLNVLFVDVNLCCVLTASSWYVEKINDWATAGHPYSDAPPRNKKVSAWLFLNKIMWGYCTFFFQFENLWTLTEFFYIWFFKVTSYLMMMVYQLFLL